MTEELDAKAVAQMEALFEAAAPVLGEQLLNEMQLRDAATELMAIVRSMLTGNQIRAVQKMNDLDAKVRAWLEARAEGPPSND